MNNLNNELVNTLQKIVNKLENTDISLSKIGLILKKIYIVDSIDFIFILITIIAIICLTLFFITWAARASEDLPTTNKWKIIIGILLCLFLAQIIQTYLRVTILTSEEFAIHTLYKSLTKDK